MLLKAPKIFRAACVLMGLLLVLAGCGTGGGSSSGDSGAGSGGSASSSSTPTPAPANGGGDVGGSQSAAEELEFVTLTWYMPSPISPQKNYDNVMAEVNRILKEKINAQLEFKFIDFGSFEEKMRVMSASGEPYDLVFTASWINKLPINVLNGAFLPLDELLEKYGQNVLQKVEDRYWPAVTFNGKKYAIPNPTTYAQTFSFSYKKDLVDKYGFDYKNAHTLEDIEPFLETIKRNEPDITPLLAINLATPGLTDMSIQRDQINSFIFYDLPTGKFMTLFDGPEDPVGFKNFKKLAEFYQKGYIAKDAATKNDWLMEGQTGKYAVMPSPGAYSEDGSKATSVYGFPAYESLYYQAIISTNSVQSATTAISRTSKNPERAMMLVDLIYSDKYLLNLMAYGIEGQDYRIVSGAGTDNPTVETNAELTWAVWHPWIGSLWDQWPSNWNTQEALDQMKSDNDTSLVSPLLGFNFDPEPVKQEVSQIQAIADEMNPILFTGSAPDLEKYIADGRQRALNAGLQKVLAEVVRQYEEWKASNS